VKQLKKEEAKLMPLKYDMIDLRNNWQ